MFTFLYLLVFVFVEMSMFLSGLFILLLTFPFDKNRRIIHYHSYVWGLIHFWLSPRWKIKYEGKENVRPSKNYIIVSNHQSMLDICLLYKVPKLFKWVSKKEAIKIPLVGWALWLHKDVLISRGDSSSIKKMIRDCQAYLQRGASIFMFPEGTRSRDGQVQEFKEGAFMLAKITKTAILPVVIDGTFDVLPKKKLQLKYKQTFQVHVLPEISEEEVAKSSIKELTKKAYEIIRDEHQVMAPEKYGEGQEKAPFAVIFDLDGVIVDNNNFHNKAFEEFLRCRGFQEPSTVFKPRMYGTRNSEIMREIFGDLNDESINALSEEKEAIYRELYRPHIVEVEGLTRLLKDLQKHDIPVGIGSSASLSNINFVIDSLHIREYFSVIVHEQMVSEGKPDPEVYLKVASLLDFPPSRCIIFEDSIAGVQAGNRADAKTIGITTTNNFEKLSPYTVLTAPNFKKITFKTLAQMIT